MFYGFIVFLGFSFANPVCCEILNKGVTDKGLEDRNFKVTDDGFITGEIVNTSNRLRHAVELDMWITNMAGTQIYWRKSLNLGDLPPGARYEVKEPAERAVNSSLRLDFQFRVKQSGEFRN